MSENTHSHHLEALKVARGRYYLFEDIGKTAAFTFIGILISARVFGLGYQDLANIRFWDVVWGAGIVFVAFFAFQILHRMTNALSAKHRRAEFELKAKRTKDLILQKHPDTSVRQTNTRSKYLPKRIDAGSK